MVQYDNTNKRTSEKEQMEIEEKLTPITQEVVDLLEKHELSHWEKVLVCEQVRAYSDVNFFVEVNNELKKQHDN